MSRPDLSNGKRLVEMTHESGRVVYARDRREAMQALLNHDGHVYQVARLESGHYAAFRSEFRADGPMGPGRKKEFARGPTRASCADAVVEHLAKGWTCGAWQREWQAGRERQSRAGWAKAEQDWGRYVDGGRSRGRSV
jgi:hypothetical protein